MFSISSSSILRPLIFTWLSNLPKQKISPLQSNLHKSPVLYIILFCLNGFFRYLSFVISSLFKYPFPTPSPAIYSSPATPIGTGFKFVSKIYIWVFPRGFPIFISFWFVTSVNEENTVVSLGPYPLYTFSTPMFNNWSLNESGNGSPARVTYFKFDKWGISSILSKNSCIRDGVIWINWTSFFFIKISNNAGIRCSSSFAIIIFNPFCRHINVSNIKISKLAVVTDAIFLYLQVSFRKSTVLFR